MEEIFQGKCLALYSQVGIYDTEDKGSYPQWDTGEELVVFGKKGVAVSAKGDTTVELIVYEGMTNISNMILYASGIIMVGKKGLTVGNEVAATTYHIDWKEGNTVVTVYGDGPKNEAKTIVFILEYSEIE